MRHSTCAHRRTRREDSMEDLQKDKDQGEKLRSLVEVSRKNDIPALLNAKNRAQQDVYSDPSKENLAVLERATAMLEKAMDAGQNCKNWKEALTYLQEDCGRKIGQTKLFADIKAGRLRKQPDGTFKRRDLDRYAASLPTAGTPDKLATDAARRQREKEEQEIRRIRVAADKEEFILKVKQGQYISRDDVYQELAARAGVPLQYFANRSDKAGGSTLGNLAMAQVSMNCVDIGLPQLAMHSCYETAGAEDTLSLIKLMQELYSSHFEETAFGTLSISK